MRRKGINGLFLVLCRINHRNLKNPAGHRTKKKKKGKNVQMCNRCEMIQYQNFLYEEPLRPCMFWDILARVRL